MASNRYVALLRGVNLGGHNQVRMADLRALVESLGHRDVVTYINSGNVVFTSGTPALDQAALDQAALAAAIEERIHAELGLQVAVLIRSPDELADVLAANPFPDAEPARLLISFLRAEPSREAVTSAAAIPSGDDEFHVIGTTAYLHCPDGIGRSKLAAALGKYLEVDATARNLATVRKLIDLSQGSTTP